MVNPFDLPGQFWRGNLHTHSTNSDGVLSPEQVCRRYQAEGYDFIALTDHFVGMFGYVPLMFKTLRQWSAKRPNTTP